MFEEDLSNEQIRDILSAESRKNALVFFSENSREDYTRREVADYLADIVGKDVDRVETRLHHIDLPMLENADIIEYDSTEGSIRYKGDTDVEGILSSE